MDDGPNAGVTETLPIDAPEQPEQAAVWIIEAGFNTFVTAAALAYGLMVSAVVLPERLTQLTPRRT